MNKTLVGIIVAVVVLVGGFFALNSYIYNEKQADVAADYKSAEYVIEGKRVKLGTGGTQYFGNEVRKDLNGDGREDIIFLLTQNSGGSGTFFYVVAALNEGNGYVGTNAVFLGDRIAPQTTESGAGDSIIVNFADRKLDEPMTARPSVGKSMWLKIKDNTLQAAK